MEKTFPQAPHIHTDCPNYKEIQQLWDVFHAIDKQVAVDAATRNSQYETIIKLLTDNNNASAQLATKIRDLEQAQAITGFQSSRSAEFLDRITWATVSKIVIIAGTLAAIVFKLKP